MAMAAVAGVYAVIGDGVLSAAVDAVFEMMHVFSQIEVFSSRDIR